MDLIKESVQNSDQIIQYEHKYLKKPTEYNGQNAVLQASFNRKVGNKDNFYSQKILT